MIQLQNVSKTYRTDKVETLALNGIDLHVKKGEFVAMMGPSGCGKSTLLNVIVGSSRVDLQACKLEYSIVSPK